MNPILMFFCCITRARPDLVAESNPMDQMTVIANGIALLTLAVISTVAWVTFLGSYVPMWAALCIALLVVMVIMLIEAAFAASDWEIAGVLRTGQPSLQQWLKLAGRLSIAFVFSIFTAKGVNQVFFSDSIGEYQQAKRAAQNAPIEREYATRKEQIQARLVQPLEAEIKAASDARAYEAGRVRELRAKYDALREQASRATIEAGRELDGLGRVAGAGPRFRDAQRQHDESQHLSAGAAAELERSSSALRDLDVKLEKLNAQLVVRNAELGAATRAVDQEMKSDLRWKRERDDPILRESVLDELEQHSENGSAVQRIRWLTMLLLITLEMSFLMIKIWLAPASVYTVRLIAETKLEAAQVDADFVRRLAAIRSQHPRADLRIIERAEQRQVDQGGGSNDPTAARPFVAEAGERPASEHGW